MQDKLNMYLLNDKAELNIDEKLKNYKDNENFFYYLLYKCFEYEMNTIVLKLNSVGYDMWKLSKDFNDETLKKSKPVKDLIEYIKVVGGPGADHLIIEELDKRLKKINARVIVKTLTDEEKKQLSSILTVVNYYFNNIRQLQKYSTILLLLRKEIKRNCTDKSIIDELEILKESSFVFSKKITINKKQKLRYKSVKREAGFIKEIKNSLDIILYDFLHLEEDEKKDSELIKEIAWRIKRIRNSIDEYKSKKLFHSKQLQPLIAEIENAVKDAENQIIK